MNDSVGADDVPRDDARLADGILLQPLVAAGLVDIRRAALTIGRGLQVAEAQLAGRGLGGLGLAGLAGLGGRLLRLLRLLLLHGLLSRLLLLRGLLRGLSRLRLNRLRGLRLDRLGGLRLLQLGRCLSLSLSLSAESELLFDLSAAQRLVQLAAAQELDAQVGVGGEGLSDAAMGMASNADPQVRSEWEQVSAGWTSKWQPQRELKEAKQSSVTEE